jgi:hypothetical protein
VYQGEVLTDPLIKKTVPREDLKRVCSHFLSRLEEFIAATGDFIC